MAGHHHQGRGLQRVAAADEVERVLHVVGTGRNQGSGALQRRHGGEAPGGGGGIVTSLEEEIGLGEREDRDPGLGDLGCNLRLDLGRLHAERHAMAGCTHPP